MLGFDIMLDSAGKALLLEVNTHPSLSWDTSVDVTIKRPAMAGSLAIVCGLWLACSPSYFFSSLCPICGALTKFRNRAKHP
jgi:hypothetical protein